MFEKIYIEGISPCTIKEIIKDICTFGFKTKEGYTSLFISSDALEKLKTRILDRKKENQTIRISTISAEYISEPGEEYYMYYPQSW